MGPLLVLFTCAGVLSAVPPLAAPTALVTRGDDVDKVESHLRAAMEQHTGLIPAADTQLGLDQVLQAGWSCDGAPACVAQLGPALGARTILFAAVLRSNTGWELLVTVVDVAEARELRRVEASLPRDPASWKGPLTRVSRAVLGLGGELLVDGLTAGAQVQVGDETLVATGPHVRVAGLMPGHLRVRVVQSGTTEDREVLLHAGVVTTLDLTPVAAPPTTERASRRSPRRMMAGAVAAAAAVALGAGVVLGVVGSGMALAALGALGTLTRQGDGRIVARDGETREQIMLQRNVGIGLGAGAAALTTAGLGLVLVAGGAVVAAAAGLAIPEGAGT
ncbi:MAG: hypothetical protein AB2A00_15830 [Myxococcota bacterium]